MQKMWHAWRDAGVSCGDALLTDWPLCLLQGALVTAIKAVSQRSLGTPLPEVPSRRAAFLEAFRCLNPFSAQQLAGLHCSLRELLHKPPDELKRLMPETPARSLDLFMRQAALGEPVLGAQTLGKTFQPVLVVDRPL